MIRYVGYYRYSRRRWRGWMGTDPIYLLNSQKTRNKLEEIEAHSKSNALAVEELKERVVP
jgi:hypothetical protein